MSSGQSLRNGSSVEPGLPNTLRMPNARNRSKVACLTVRGLFSDFGGKGFTPSFRGDAKHRARNLEIPGLVLTHHPGMTVERPSPPAVCQFTTLTRAMLATS